MKWVKIVNHKRKWIALEVPRCGCTMLKTLALSDTYDFDFRQIIGSNPHGLLGYTPESSNGIIQPYEYTVDGYTTFAVWRDPVMRSYSTWRGFCTGDHESQNHFRLDSPSYVDWYWYVKWQLENTPDPDVHIRSQTMFYTPEDVNHVVLLEDLNQYLVTQLGYSAGELSEGLASCYAQQTDQTASEDTQALFGELYKTDFEIPGWTNFWRTQ